MESRMKLELSVSPEMASASLSFSTPMALTCRSSRAVLSRSCARSTWSEVMWPAVACMKSGSFAARAMKAVVFARAC